MKLAGRREQLKLKTCARLNFGLGRNSRDHLLSQISHSIVLPTNTLYTTHHFNKAEVIRLAVIGRQGLV